MWKLIYAWRFYSYGREQYHECMGKLFIGNLYGLRQMNTIVAIFVSAFSLVPVFTERNFIKMGVCLVAAFIAAIVAYIANYKMQRTIPTNRFVYFLTIIFYTNLMMLGVYLCVLSAPEQLATLYLCFLICSLLMLINPPIFNLLLTIGAIVIFVIAGAIFKKPAIFINDLINTFIAGIISLYFGWQITKLRLGLELSTTLLEEERNKYLDQSTIDELTQLSNRRDFMNTFQRYLTNYRSFDTWLCISISDIDFFKNYNDHYGHPQGDVCLRAVGGAFNKLKESMGVYTARVGGEEFAMLWFEKDAANVDPVINKITELIRDLKIPHEKSKIGDYVTMSVGVYVERCGASSDVQTLYDLADKALYRAKGSGRNCAIITGREIEEYKITPSS